MKILTVNKSVYFLFFSLQISSFSFAQEAKITLNQDPKFEQLLNEKRKINSSITVNDRYKIQIFNGDSENSKKTLISFKKENKN